MAELKEGHRVPYEMPDIFENYPARNIEIRECVCVCACEISMKNLLLCLYCFFSFLLIDIFENDPTRNIEIRECVCVCVRAKYLWKFSVYIYIYSFLLLDIFENYPARNITKFVTVCSREISLRTRLFFPHSTYAPCYTYTGVYLLRAFQINPVAGASLDGHLVYTRTHTHTHTHMHNHANTRKTSTHAHTRVKHKGTQSKLRNHTYTRTNTNTHTHTHTHTPQLRHGTSLHTHVYSTPCADCKTNILNPIS